MTGATSYSSRYEPPENDSIIQGAGTAPTSRFITNAISAMKHGETTTEQTHLHTQLSHHIPPDRQVVTDSLMTHQSHPPTEMHQCVSGVVNKST